MKIVILPLSITSSWGNGHATNFRALGRALARRGHEVTFLERDRPWYASARDFTGVDYAMIHLYDSVEDLKTRFSDEVRNADVTIVGSYVPDGVEVTEWATDTCPGATFFYDIDTPVTLEKLRQGDFEYLAPESIPRFDMYLSFAGGRSLEILESDFGARRAEPFYCIVDPDEYQPETKEYRWDLGYLGTYSPDRAAPLHDLLVDPARRSPGKRFCVAGPNHPDYGWPSNIERIDHLPPHRHRDFYCSQRFTLNVTRAQMIAAGHSPSVRLFEAAACGVPIISDRWAGIEDLFVPGQEILLVDSAAEVVDLLNTVDEETRDSIGRAARRRILQEHTADHRAQQLEGHVDELAGASHGS